MCEPSKPKRLSYYDGSQVLSVVHISGNYYAYADAVIQCPGDDNIFESKSEAMYAKLIPELSAGKPISNFKASPYYKYYLDRLKKENPEYLL